MNTSRRGFLKGAAVLGGVAVLPDVSAADAGSRPDLVGKVWPGWTEGHFQLHSIYTGVGESMFLVFPDGTTMLLDCGDHPAINRGELAVPVLPGGGRHAGEWVARYVQRVNPSKDRVDYLVVSHFHSDHTGIGNWGAGMLRQGRHEYRLSGFAQAAEWLKFGRAVDRGWPNYDEPKPIGTPEERASLDLMRRLYARLAERDGLTVEKFRLGTSDQFVPLRGRSDGFAVRNICANGKIVLPDGTVKDLYAERLKRNPKAWLNENGMSLGMLFTYGRFSLFTAGDFSDQWQEGGGRRILTEEALAAAVPRVNVAKVNHHGHHAMPRGLVKALSPQVWFSCVWDQLHNTADTMQNLYEGSPASKAYPGIFPAERRWADRDAPWFGMVPESLHSGGHVIVDVPPGGKRYTVSVVSARDESMKVVDAVEFAAARTDAEGV